MKNETVFTELTLKFLMEEEIFERIVDLWNTNLWRRSNQILKSNRYYSSDQGTSMLAAHLKNTLLSSFDINQPEYVNPKKYNGGEPINIKTSIEDIHTRVTVETEEEGFYY